MIMRNRKSNTVYSSSTDYAKVKMVSNFDMIRNKGRRNENREKNGKRVEYDRFLREVL